MDGFETNLASPERLRPADRFTDVGRRRMTRKSVPDPTLRCVSSGYLSDGCSCRSTISTSVVTAAWASEQRTGVRGDRLFHFAWHGEVWLAYGLKNGRIRGVYCPEHSAARDRRSFIDGPRESAPPRAASLTARAPRGSEHARTDGARVEAGLRSGGTSRDAHSDGRAEPVQ